MKEPTKIQKLIWWIQDIPMKIKQVSCYHRFEFDMRDAVSDKWGRCSGATRCEKCFMSSQYTIYLFEKP